MSKENSVATGIIVGIKEGEKVKVAAEAYENIANLASTRGGNNNFGFVAEELVAKDMNIKFLEQGLDKKAVVIDNNGLADIHILEKSSGELVEAVQVKFYGENTPVDVSKYVEADMKVVVQKNCPESVISKMESQRAEVIESDTSTFEANVISKSRQLETSVTKNKTSPLSSKSIKAGGILNQAHNAGLKGAVKSGVIAGGSTLGSNLVEVARGEKDLVDAGIDVALITTKASAVGYVGTAGASLVASTATGTAVIGAVGNTTIGATLLKAGAVISGAPILPVFAASVVLGGLKALFSSGSSSDYGGNLLSLDVEEMMCIEVDTKEANLLLKEFFKEIEIETERRTEYYKWLS